MGTTLTGTQINNTYDGLIKTTDNTAITATTKLISDGLGNDSCIKVGTAGTDFLGAVDFSAATVTGLPGGAAGLVSGTGTDSIKNADSLVTTPATSAQTRSIAIGNNAYAPADGTTDGIAIGCSSQAYGGSGSAVAVGKAAIGHIDGVGIGNSAKAFYGGIAVGATSCSNLSFCGIAIGYNACITTNLINSPIAIGTASRNNGDGAIAIGRAACVVNSTNIAIGCGATTGPTASPNGIAIGANANASYNGTVIGTNSNTGTAIHSDGAIAVGHSNTATGNGSITIGWRSNATGACTYVIGENITSARVCALVTHQVEATVAGKGIIVTSPDGLTTLGIGIDNTGAIVTYTP